MQCADGWRRESAGGVSACRLVGGYYDRSDAAYYFSSPGEGNKIGCEMSPFFTTQCRRILVRRLYHVSLTSTVERSRSMFAFMLFAAMLLASLLIAAAAGIRTFLK